jgi:hypothetical protein
MESNQQHYHSELWGDVEFFPVSGKSVATKCKHCILQRTDIDCLSAPCTSLEREDGLDGYYSIHQMPNEQNQ